MVSLEFKELETKRDKDSVFGKRYAGINRYPSLNRYR